jgi:hypothetical protein
VTTSLPDQKVPLPKRVSRFQVALVALATSALLTLIAWNAFRPQPIRSLAPRGSNPTHYEIEIGPAPGLLDALKQDGQVPSDAIDDGQGHFVSPATLTSAQLDWAERVAQRRAARRAARSN